jgi:hypothetical protein
MNHKLKGEIHPATEDDPVEREALALACPVLDTGYLIRGEGEHGNVKGVNALVLDWT